MENNALNYWMCRLSVAFVWVYHGIFPKLLGPHRDEMAMNMAAGFDPLQAARVAYWGGVGEVLFGFVILVFWRQRWPLMLSAAAMVGLLLFVLIFIPQLTLAAFNPVTTNFALFILSVIAYRLHKQVN